MRIECPTCQKDYTLPNDRLPQGKVVSFPCPACKGKITLDLHIQEDKPDASAERLIFKPLSEEAEKPQPWSNTNWLKGDGQTGDGTSCFFPRFLR